MTGRMTRLFAATTIALSLVLAGGAPGQTTQPAPSTAPAERKTLALPPGFRLVVEGDRRVLCQEGDEAWVRQALADKSPTTRPTTMPSDLAERLGASRPALVDRLTADLALTDRTAAAKFVDEQLIPLLAGAARYRPPVFYLVTTRDTLREIVKNGWSDPTNRYHYNRAADQVAIPTQLQLSMEGESDDQVLAVLHTPEQDLTARRELLTRLKQGTLGTLHHDLVADLEADASATLLSVNSIVASTHPLMQAKEAATSIARDSVPLLARSSAVTEVLTRNASGFGPLHFGAAASALLALLSLLMMARAYGADVAARRLETERQRQQAEDERNLTQQAILRLMNEMGDLADGDLTVQATVTEDITGAIADSVNYAIEELRNLVQGINRAADHLTQASTEARTSSDELLAATERQSLQIAETTESVNQMSQSISEVSRNTAESAHVAEQSLATARRGGDSVRGAIAGMNAIRDQIQETSKRIKRLGESSQEIGEIVDLISDITEQTNVLALNAAIQAASAGEAGRGFTVVAEEVQRLAERSAEATKQIAAIVKTIQTDTQDAVGAMENATRNVVEGAQLSDAAGQALAEIGEVSTETAPLIERISADTQEQAATAGRVAATMKDILAVTEQTSLGTRQTAVSIGQLAELAVELKGSVSGFKV